MDKGELRKKYEELTKQKLRASIAQREQEGQLDKLLEEAEGKSPKKLEEGSKAAPGPAPEPTPEKTPTKKAGPGDEAGSDDRMSSSSEESERRGKTARGYQMVYPASWRLSYPPLH